MRQWVGELVSGPSSSALLRCGDHVTDGAGSGSGQARLILLLFGTPRGFVKAVRAAGFQPLVRLQMDSRLAGHVTLGARGRTLNGARRTLGVSV